MVLVELQQLLQVPQVHLKLQEHLAQMVHPVLQQHLLAQAVYHKPQEFQVQTAPQVPQLLHQV